MNSRDILKKEFDAEEGSFILIARCELRWDWDAFHRLTNAMYHVALITGKQEKIELWIANGFWFCDTWIREWTSHPNFPRPEKEQYDNAIELIRDLAYFLFYGESPYEDDTLRRLATTSKL